MMIKNLTITQPLKGELLKVIQSLKVELLKVVQPLKVVLSMKLDNIEIFSYQGDLQTLSYWKILRLILKGKLLSVP